MANLLEKASILITPTAYSDGKIHSAKPIQSLGGLDADLDFTRGSSATRVNADGLIESSQGINTPRINYENGAGSLLLEPASTNLVTQSEAFDNAYWTKSGATVTSGFSAPSIDSPLGAFKLVATANNASVSRLISGLSNVNYTSSVYIKRVTGTGDVRLVQPDGNIFVVVVTSEWKRFDASTLPSLGVDGYVGVNLAVLGDEVMIFASQLEQKSYATSYIPTAGTIISRTADYASKSGLVSNNLISSTGFTLFYDTLIQEDAVNNYLEIIALWGASNNIRIEKRTNNYVYLQQIGIVSSGDDFNSTSIGNSTSKKFAISVSNSVVKVYVDGTQYSSDYNGVYSWDLDSIGFRSGDTSVETLIKCKQLQVYNTALTDAELTCLTTI